MARVGNLTVDLVAEQGLAASQPHELVRLGELLGLLSGVAPLGHHHVAAEIDDLSSALLQLLQSNFVDTASVYWTNSGTRANVRLRTNGGLLVGVDGLYVDSGTVAVLGHKHKVVDITDFASGVQNQMALTLKDSQTVFWQQVSGTLFAHVRRKPNGALLQDSGGLYVDLGSGTNQAAAGDHSHALLHKKLTVQPSTTITVTLNDQDLGLEVLLAPNGGLFVLSGVRVDFGSGTNQVARGNHTHANDHLPVTVVSTNSLVLGISANQVLSGTVRLDPAPSAGRGKLGVGALGLYVELGSGVDQAAAGNHGHVVATSGSDGFMSSSDKRKLDALAAAAGTSNRTGLQVVFDNYGAVLTPGIAQHIVMPFSGTITGWDITSTTSGTLRVDLWKDTWDNWPPTVVDSIVAGNHPFLSGTHNQNLTVNWPFNLGDVIAFNLISGSIAFAKKVVLGLRIDKL